MARRDPPHRLQAWLKAAAGLALVLGSAGAGRAADPPPAPAAPAADTWFTNAVTWPAEPAPAPGGRAGFESLHAETMVGRYLLYSWTPAALDTNAAVSLVISAGEPGHWPARDWQILPMSVSGPAWTARPPLASARTPLIYWVRVVAGGRTNSSPARLVRPDLAGLTGPDRPFWPFLEGFEQGAGHWVRVLDTNERSGLAIGAEGHSGYHALQVRLAAGQHSATVATTLVRGWQLLEAQATGLRLWLRTSAGTGTVRFTLHANALTPRQVARTSTVAPVVTTEWQAVVVPLDSFPQLPPAEVDWFAIEFIGQGPAELLVDDLELAGPWPPATEP